MYQLRPTEPTDITVNELYNELGERKTLEILRCLRDHPDPQNRFCFGLHTYRLVLEVELDEPVIYMGQEG